MELSPRSLEQARIAAEFAASVRGTAKGARALPVSLFAWLAGMNYLTRQAPDPPDLEDLHPRTILDAYLNDNRLPPEFDSFEADRYWEAIDLYNSAFSEPTYLERLGFTDLPHQAIEKAPPELLGRFVINIWDGKPAPGLEDCVGLGDEAGTIYCSGVVVASRAVLTVHHCREARYVHTFNLIGTKPYKIKAAKALGSNVTLLLTHNRVPVEPAPLARKRKIEAQQKFLVAGFGLTGTGTGDYSMDRRKTILFAISHSCQQPQKYGCEKHEMVLGAPVLKPSGICKGDSGGPAYTMTGSKRCLAALTRTLGKNPVSVCTDVSNHVRIDHLWGKIDGQLSDWGLEPTQKC